MLELAKGAQTVRGRVWVLWATFCIVCQNHTASLMTCAGLHRTAPANLHGCGLAHRCRLRLRGGDDDYHVDACQAARVGSVRATLRTEGIGSKVGGGGGLDETATHNHTWTVSGIQEGFMVLQDELAPTAGRQGDEGRMEQERVAGVKNLIDSRCFGPSQQPPAPVSGTPENLQ